MRRAIEGVWRATRGQAAWIAWVSLAVVVAIDLRTPQTLTLLAVPIVLLGLIAPRRRLAIEIAAGVTVLTVAVVMIEAHQRGLPLWIFNRTVAIVVIWTTALGVTMYRAAASRQEESAHALEEMRQALDQSAIVAITDVPGRITFVNDKFCEISKYSRDELIGQDHRILNSGFHGDAFIRDLWRTIAQGRVWRGELRNRAKDGSIYWVDTTIIPFLDARGKPRQYMAIRYDITARKAQEEQLRNQAALAAVGEFAAVVAHEVRNPLAGIRNAVQLIAADLPPGSDSVGLSHDIVVRIDSLNAVIGDLLLFARPRTPALVPVVLQTLLSDVASAFAQDPAMQGISVALTGLADLAIEGDEDQLRLVFLNLFVNAGQAMEGQGTLTIAIEDAGRAASIAVEDTGPGIPAEVRARIFEPFFTTKHRGTGLGLPTVKRIVEAHHGTITIEDRPGGGTRVRVGLAKGKGLGA
jgi:PAS domain S-box-containing protein